MEDMTQAAENIHTDTPEAVTEETKTEGLAESAGKETGAPDAYDFKGIVPDGEVFDEEIASGFGNLCKEMNLTQEMASKMAEYGFSYAGRVKEAMEAAKEAEVGAWAEDTRRLLGSSFDKTMGDYGRALVYLERENPDIRAVLNSTGAGNKAEVVKAFALLGRLISEDPGLTAGKAASSKDDLYPNTNFEAYR